MQGNKTPSLQEPKLGLEMQEVEQKSPIINIANPRHKSVLKKILLSFLVAQTLFYTSFTPGTEPETKTVEIPKEIRDRTHISQTHVEIRFQGREPTFRIGGKAEAADGNDTQGSGGMWQSDAMQAAMGLIGGIPIGNNVKYTFSSSGENVAYVICNTTNTSPEIGSDAVITCYCSVIGGGQCAPAYDVRAVQYKESGTKSEDFAFETFRPCPDGRVCKGSAAANVNAVVYDGSTSLAHDFGDGSSNWDTGTKNNPNSDGGFKSTGTIDDDDDDKTVTKKKTYTSTTPESTGTNGKRTVSATNPTSTGWETSTGGFDGIDPTTKGGFTDGGGIDGVNPTSTDGGIEEGTQTGTEGLNGGTDGGIISEGGNIKSDTGKSSFGGGINDLLNDSNSSFNAGDEDWSNSNTGLGDIGDYLDSAFTDDNAPPNLTNDLLGLEEDFLNSVSNLMNDDGFNSDGDPTKIDGLYDENGNYIGDGLGSEGYYDEYGNYIGPGGYDKDGNFVGSGGMYDEKGTYVGPGGHDADGNLVGAGGLYDANGNYVGPGGYDENGNFVGEGGMYDKNGNYIGNGKSSGNGAFNTSPDNPFAMLQSMLGMNGTDSNNNNGLFGDLANSSLVNNTPLLRTMIGGNEEEIKKNTVSNQELFERAFKFLKGMGLSNNDILKGKTYDPNSAWTDPKIAWDFNRITTLLRRHQVKLNEKTGWIQAETPRVPRQRMSDTMSGGHRAHEASGETSSANPNMRTVQ